MSKHANQPKLPEDEHQHHHVVNRLRAILAALAIAGSVGSPAVKTVQDMVTTQVATQGTGVSVADFAELIGGMLLGIVELIRFLAGDLGPGEREAVAAMIRSEGLDPEQRKDVEEMIRRMLAKQQHGIAQEVERNPSSRSQLQATLLSQTEALRSMSVEPALRAEIIEALERTRRVLTPTAMSGAVNRREILDPVEQEGYVGGRASGLGEARDWDRGDDKDKNQA